MSEITEFNNMHYIAGYMYTFRHKLTIKMSTLQFSFYECAFLHITKIKNFKENYTLQNTHHSKFYTSPAYWMFTYEIFW